MKVPASASHKQEELLSNKIINVSTLSNAILKLMKQVVLGRCWSNFQDVVGIYWSATAPAPSEHLFWARVRKECLHVSLSQVPHKFHEIMHRRRNRSSKAKFSKS